MENPGLSVGDIVDVTTERLAYGGDAIARHQGLAVFIPFAAPSERLRVHIIERKKNFARAVIDKILEPSPSRREAACRYFGHCGGCQLQHLTYAAQLEAKAGFVRDAIERIGGLDWPHQIEIRHAAEFGYRGRAQLKLDCVTGTVGFNRTASNAVCDVSSCPILVPELDRALRSVRDAFASAPVEDQIPNRLRVDLAAGESGVSFNPAFAGLPGGALQRTIKDATYNFGPSTFFQANPGLLDELVDEAIGSDAGDVAIDLYAGVGLFTIQLARRFTRVIGVEGDRSTAQFATENIIINRVENVEFKNAGVEAWMKSFAHRNPPSPDLIVLDPPRTGAAGSINHIAAARPSRISYISCDPSTLARDLRTLVSSGYDVTKVIGIDLFPQTYHVETVASLALR